MKPLVTIIEAILFGERLLVTFADGKMALLDSGPIYDVAVVPEVFLLPPADKKIV
jgi:hypothetical protein